jgi:hypothetical protein
MTYLASKALIVWKLFSITEQNILRAVDWNVALYCKERWTVQLSYLFSLPLIYLIYSFLINITCFFLTYRTLVSSFISEVLLHALFFHSVSFYLTFYNLFDTVIIFSVTLSIYGNHVFWKRYSGLYTSHVFFTLICSRHDLAAVQLHLLRHHFTCSFAQDILWSLKWWLHVEMQPGVPNTNIMREWTRIQKSKQPKDPGVEVTEYTGTKQRLSKERLPLKVRNYK